MTHDPLDNVPRTAILPRWLDSSSRLRRLPATHSLPTPTPLTHTFELQPLQRLLDIVEESLDAEKEIFDRGVISNTSDALERHRQLQLTKGGVYEAERRLEIRVSTDVQATTITIEDRRRGDGARSS